MSLSTFSIRKPVFAWMLMFGLMFFGWISFKDMGISLLPDVDFPVVNVSIEYEGAAPEVIETDVVDVLENSIMTVQGIKNVKSTSRYGSAQITIEFDLDRDIDAALQEVQSKIAQSQRQLPKNIEAPVITKINPEDRPILMYNINSKTMPKTELMRYARDILTDKFTTVSGVGDVSIAGYVEPNLRVWINNKKLNQFELTVGDVLTALHDEHVELPSGQIDDPRNEYDIRTIGEAKSINEIEKLIINSRGGRPNYAPVTLSTVADIENGLAETRRYARANGVPAIGIAIRKQRGTNSVAVAKAVHERASVVKASLPDGVNMNLTFDSTKFVEDSVGELTFTLLLSAILTGFACWLFLGSFSSTINVLFAIPTSILGAFIFLKFSGFTLNTFTLLGLSLAIGIVVDDAIMVLENIVRHRESGKSRRRSALDGSREITPAAIAATLAIVAIFLPVAFMSGVIGKYFLQFGITMTVTVLLSLLEALTLTPMRCSQFIEPASRNNLVAMVMEKLLKRMSTKYKTILLWALNNRLKVIGFSTLFFLISLVSIMKINKEFVPKQDQGMLMIRLETSTDSSLAFTDEQMKKVESYLLKRPEVLRFMALIGGMSSMGGEINTGMLFVTLKDVKDRTMSQEEFIDSARKDFKKIKDAKIILQDLSVGGFSTSRGFPIEFSIQGSDWTQLENISNSIMKKMETSGLMIDVDSDFKKGKPEIHIIPDRKKSAERGVSVRSISETVQATIGGVVSGKFPFQGHRYDIRVRLIPEERSRIDQIKNLFVRNNRGELVKLADVIELEKKYSFQKIIRYDRERSITVSANIMSGKSQSDAISEVTKITNENLPSGYNIRFSGNTETFKQSGRDLVLALVLGVIVAYMVLGSQFNSFIDPFVVLLALPFSISGAFIALLITGQSINIFSFIGIILLMGIVKKNSILLVEFTNQIRANKKIDVKNALLEACPIRMRPIIMTSTATIAASIPPALALGPGAETRIPMAITVIGGVILSTILTLVVVPCAYSLLSKFERRKFIEECEK